MQVLYTAIATATGDGRNGHTATDDGVLDGDVLDGGVRVPMEMGVPGGATNPEQPVARAHQVCPYSNATRGTIDVTPRVV